MDDFVYQSKIKVHYKTKLIHFLFSIVLKYEFCKLLENVYTISLNLHPFKQH